MSNRFAKIFKDANDETKKALIKSFGTQPRQLPASSPTSGLLESVLTPGSGGGGGKSVVVAAQGYYHLKLIHAQVTVPGPPFHGAYGGHRLTTTVELSYDDYELSENRTNAYLEAVDEVARSAAILGLLDNEVYTVARAAKLTAAITSATIFVRLQREFRRLSMPCVVHAALKDRCQDAGRSIQ
ncbi:unnamed protein product [Schistocephalus solidus]|uniref:Uncharacterized protein n=1 Tax=Schistocephalus solidus TaxID=70667 RepID=A0A3P7EXB2_SCHSO|nr:unnamed protein product [Schistocephalus solidus]